MKIEFTDEEFEALKLLIHCGKCDLDNGHETAEAHFKLREGINSLYKRLVSDTLTPSDK